MTCHNYIIKIRHIYKTEMCAKIVLGLRQVIKSFVKRAQDAQPRILDTWFIDFFACAVLSVKRVIIHATVCVNCM